MHANSGPMRPGRHEPAIGSTFITDSYVKDNKFVTTNNVGYTPTAETNAGAGSARPAASSRLPQLSVPTVFINYRTGDEEASAALIDRELSRRFGSQKIFRAEKSVRPGDDITTTIIDAVRRSKALVAVIGRHWLTAVDEDGGRAIDNEKDWTRLEIVEAFEHSVRVIPVLVGKVPHLTADDLPAALSRLPDSKYLRLNYREVDAGLGRLADQLAELVPGLDDGTE